MKKNKSLIIILLIVVIGVIGLTLAYFINTANITNEFKSKEYGTTVTEEFTSPENWLPGSTEPKTLIVTNNGQVDEAVRVSYTESWTSKNSNQEGDLSLTQNNNRVAIINFANSSDWTKVTENNKDYYYYNYKLAPGETTSTLLDSVTFNSAITNDGNCVTTTDNETHTKTITCNSTGNGYDGATYKLTFTVETVQYDKYSDAWGTNANIVANKPLFIKGLKVNNADKIYANGDRTAMFAFSHPQTEQMRSTTDYRYIGNQPNNYVKFNCDNDGENCEIWRIIGVFEVDDGTGNYEQRIKIVRGSALPEKMIWDDREPENYMWDLGKNDWNGAKINIFLNSDYLNRENTASTFGLKALAQSQLAVAKYYLGSSSWSNVIPHYGSTEDMYSWERGTIVYTDRPTSWIGTVGLMYPSDYGFTYSKGVSDECYNSPDVCHDKGAFGSSYVGENAYPDFGWIYNSNISQNQDKIDYTWLLSSDAGNSNSVFKIYPDGMISAMSAEEVGNIRPVLYLKPSINIISGEGTEQNPYVLG